MAASAMSFSAACAGVRVVGAPSSSKGSSRSRAMMAGRAPNVGKVVAMKGSPGTGARKESMKRVSGVTGAKRAQRGKVSVGAVHGVGVEYPEERERYA